MIIKNPPPPPPRRGVNDITFHEKLKQGTKTVNSYDEFENIFLEIMNKHAPCKTKYVRVNESMFMNRKLKKEIMIRSKLKKKHGGYFNLVMRTE